MAWWRPRSIWSGTRPGWWGARRARRWRRRWRRPATRSCRRPSAEAAEARGVARDRRWGVAPGVPVMAPGRSHGAFGGRVAWLGVQAILTVVVVAGPGRRFLVGAWKSARAKSADMSTLVALGV